MQNKIAFFGTSHFSIITLDVLKNSGILPTVIITQIDKPKGRGLVLTPPDVKIWAQENNIPCLQPTNLKDEKFLSELKKSGVEVFVVIAYGKIIPKEVLEIPKFGSLNIHASLLPKYRGASPLESAILADDKNTGVTIIKIDNEMDHGPIIAQEKVIIENWPLEYMELGTKLVEAGSKLLVKILPDYIAGKITFQEQDHSQATYTKKIIKLDGEIDLNSDPYQNYLKIKAFSNWPGTYFFKEINGKQTRFIIKKAVFENNTLKILRVIPEGKKEIDFTLSTSCISSKDI